MTAAEIRNRILEAVSSNGGHLASSLGAVEIAMALRKVFDPARDRIVCAAHGAQFELDTGICTLGPCLGELLTPVALNLHDTGEIHLAADRQKETHS